MNSITSLSSSCDGELFCGDDLIWSFLFSDKDCPSNWIISSRESCFLTCGIVFFIFDDDDDDDDDTRCVRVSVGTNSSHAQWYWTIFGWLNDARTRTSRKARFAWRRVRSVFSLKTIFLIAYIRSSKRFLARNTEPKKIYR